VVAHIRKATQGRVSLENSHPFTRELWGQTWSFAHNGDLKLFDPKPAVRAVGRHGQRARLLPPAVRAGAALRAAARTPPAVRRAGRTGGAIAEHGTFNFILSNGDLLFAHCSTELHVVVRAYPFSVAHLVDCELSIDFSRHNQLDDRIAVIATQPLTSNEQWTRFARAN
jgi:glutamine amidotransferase